MITSVYATGFVLVLVLLILILRVISRGLRDHSSNLCQAVEEMKQMNARGRVDLNSLINPPPPPCHHTWRTVQKENLDGSGERKLICIMECEDCGALDKTVESVRVDPLKSECRHSWVTQRTKEIESAYEQICDNNKKAAEMCENPEPWMFRKCYVVTRICARCGEINSVVASNYDIDDVPVADEQHEASKS